MLALSPDKIGIVMGLDPIPQTFSALEKAIANGIPKAALKHSVKRLVTHHDEILPLLYRIVPEGTFKRRKARLTPEESERTERLARVFATALYVLEADEDARQFLHTPHPMLEGRAPLDVAFSELGAQRVERILWASYYGLAA